MILIGIMTAMIIPEMKGTYQDALLRSTSRELVNVCNLASSRAVSFNQPHRLRLDPLTGKYRVEKRVRLQKEGSFVPLGDVPGSEGTLDTRIAIQFHPPGEMLSDTSREESSGPAPGPDGNSAPAEPGIVLGFYPDGTADAGELVLQDRDGFRLALRLNPTTARIRIAELERETIAAAGTGEGNQ